MALLDEKNLAAEAAKRARFRVHHVGTKLNEAELHELEGLAAKGNETQAELIRGLILREIKQDKTGLRPSAEMVEMLMAETVAKKTTPHISTLAGSTNSGCRVLSNRQETAATCESILVLPRSLALIV